MKITNSVIIDAPIETVWKQFTHPEAMYNWQPMLKSFYAVEDEGVDAKRVYDYNGKEVTLDQINVPSDVEHQKIVVLRGDQLTKRYTDTFTPQRKGTNWQRTVEVIADGLFDKIATVFKKNSEKKENKQQMQLFKNYIEEN